MNDATAETLERRFSYVFTAPEGSLYPPILALNRIDGPVTVDGPGGPIVAQPFSVPHGRIDALGFRFGPAAYLPDVSAMSEEAWAAVQGLDCWIVDALRYEPHMTHSHLSQTLEWIERAAPRRAVITNMHIDLDYDRVAAETPDHVIPAHDGLSLTFEI
jgi:phosphoribosyl 1,2-cyclic phosphate phosphodiesterase